jgi:hypothetical protein
MELRLAAVTINVVAADNVPVGVVTVAVIVVDPGLPALAVFPPAIEATVVLEEVQVAVKVCADPSAKVPVAVRGRGGSVVEIVGLFGLTEMLTSNAGLTVSETEALVTPAHFAWIVTVPVPKAVASPLVFTPAEDMPAVVDATDQATVSVKSHVLPSEYLPVAVNCWV